jgi:hypothetical protein
MIYLNHDQQQREVLNDNENAPSINCSVNTSYVINSNGVNAT